MTSGFMGFNLKEQKVTLFNQGRDTWSTTTLGTIGLAVKNALLLPDETANRYLYIDSFTVSQNQVLDAFQRATGREWEVEHVEAEEMKKTGMEKMSRGDLSGAMSLIRYINCVHGHGGNFAEYKSTANALLSLPEENLDETVSRILGL